MGLDLGLGTVTGLLTPTSRLGNRPRGRRTARSTKATNAGTRANTPPSQVGKERDQQQHRSTTTSDGHQHQHRSMTTSSMTARNGQKQQHRSMTTSNDHHQQRPTP